MVVVVVTVLLLLLLGCYGAAESSSNSGNNSNTGVRVKLTSRQACHGPSTTSTIFSSASSSGRFGVITSPDRHGKMICQWVILNPQRETLLLSFTRFDLEVGRCAGDHKKCCSQWLMLYTGDIPGGREWGRKVGAYRHNTLLHHHFTLGLGEGGDGDVVGAGKVCGSDLPGPVVTQAPRVFIKYFLLAPLPSLSSVAGHSGFRMVYYAMTNGTTCGPNEFTCTNSQVCLPRAHLCDGQVDCPDHSDENTCGRKVEEVEPSSCQQQPTNVLCDGMWHCPQGEDEKGCLGCGKDQWWCGVGQECYGLPQRCDGIPHCTNAMDELSCSPKCHHQVACWGGGCYLLSQRCDGSSDCGDASDEANCSPSLCNPQNGTFLCDNRRCIRETWRCDQLDDCRDGSDEQDCLRNSVIGVAAMGGLVCSLLLVVAVGCTGRLYALRMGLTRLQGGSRSGGGSGQRGGAGRSPHVPRSRLEEHLLQREMPPPYDVAVSDQSSPLFGTWGCHRQWRRTSLPQERAESPPSTAPRVPVYGGAPPRDPHPHHPTTQGLTVEIRQGGREGGEKVEERAGESAFFSTCEGDVPLLSALMGGGCHERGGEEDDVPLLLDLISTSSTSTSTCELDSDEDLGSVSVGLEGDEEALRGMKEAATPSHHPDLLLLTPQHPAPSPSSSTSSSSFPEAGDVLGGDVLSDTRAAVVALSAVQSHMDSMTHSDTEMISQ